MRFHSSQIFRLRVVLLALPLARATCAEFRAEDPVVADVPAAFAAIDGHPSRLAIWPGDIVRYPFYSLNPDHDFGDNHFQGVQRLRGGNYAVISGSNIGRAGDLTVYGLPQPPGLAEFKPPHSNLFVAHLASRPAQGPWGSNLDPATQRPATSDRLVADEPISIPLPSGTILWHAGGIGVLGDILAVPVENYSAKHGELGSQILFYDLSNPQHPRLFPHRIDRATEPVKDKSGGATMIRLADGRFLLATQTTAFVSFYLSKSSDFAAGFEAAPAAVVDEKKVSAAPGLAPAKFGGASIHFVRQADGALFLVTLRHPKRKGEGETEASANLALLWRVDFPAGDYHAAAVLTRVADREFTDDALARGAWGDFGAAAGLYTTDDGKLAIYSTARWQTDQPGRGTSRADFKAGRYVHRGDEVIIPMVEFWPR